MPLPMPADARILVLQLKRIGDLILTGPALAALKSGLPDSRVTLLTDRVPGGLIPGLPVDEGHARGTPGFWAAAFRGNYDAVLDFTGTDRSALLAAGSRARLRATYARFRNRGLRRFLYNRWVESTVRERHTIDHHNDLLEAIGIANVQAGTGLNIPAGARTRADSVLSNSGICSPYAIIHPGTARAEKAWPAGHWAHVARDLLSRGLAVGVTGSADPAERDQVGEVVGMAPGAVGLAGRLSLLELAAAIAGARIFCGVDSAAMHLAGAAGTPCVALFGPTNPFHWQPRGTTCRILRSRTSPPFLPSQKGGPMEEITPQAVLAAVQELLES